jgi:hypothetical protein
MWKEKVVAYVDTPSPYIMIGTFWDVVRNGTVYLKDEVSTGNNINF